MIALKVFILVICAMLLCDFACFVQKFMPENYKPWTLVFVIQQTLILLSFYCIWFAAKITP